MEIETYTWENFAISNDIVEVEKELIMMYNQFNVLTPKFGLTGICSHGDKVTFELVIAESIISFYDEMDIELSVPDDYKDKFIVERMGNHTIVIWGE